MCQPVSTTAQVEGSERTQSPLHYVVGGLYTKARNVSRYDITAPVILPAQVGTIFLPAISQSPTPLRTESFAIYGETSYDLFGGKLVPLVGLRYFQDRRSVLGTAILYPTFAPPGVSVPGAAAGTFHAFSPRLNLSYKPNNEVTVFVNAARGFRSGSVNTLGQIAFASRDGVATTQVINPDNLWSYELGTKLRSPDHTLSLQASLYHTYWRDIQLPFNTSSGIVATVNGGAASLTGVDLDVTWRTPLAGLSLQFVGNINDSHFTRINPGLTASAANLRRGRQLPTVPRVNVSFGVSYRRPITDSVDFDLYTAYSYRDRQQDAGSGLYSADLDLLSFRRHHGSRR